GTSQFAPFGVSRSTSTSSVAPSLRSPKPRQKLRRPMTPAKPHPQRREERRMTISTDFIWQEVHWSRPLDVSQATTLLRRLATDARRDTVIFEARALEGAVRHVVGTAAHQVK